MANEQQHPAERLATIKSLMGLTDRQMAERLALRLARPVGRSTLTNILGGASRPGRDLAVAIFQEFGVPVDSWTDVVTRSEAANAA
jgi:transcriptional regulator with XRE-family HTH domain